MKVRQSLSAREADDLITGLQRRLGDTSLPTLPEVAMGILELVSRPNSTIKQFTEVIKTDQSLTGRLLRLANSAQFAQRTPVTTLDRAMILLGMDRLKAMALGFHLSKAAAGSNRAATVKQLWTQSLYHGLLAHRVAERVNREVAGEAFIVGLMSDAGVSMMPKLAGENYHRSVNPSDPPAKQFLDEYRNLELTHVDVAVTLAKMWKLPDLLATPIANHHTPPIAVNTSDSLSVLNAIGFYVGLISTSDNGVASPGEPPASVARRLFEFGANDIATLNAQAAEDLRATRDFFGDLVDHAISVDEILMRADACLGVGSKDRERNDLDDGQTPIDTCGRVEAAGLVFEFEKTTNGNVTAYIADASGNRLLSEVFNPQTQTDDQIRMLLMLDTASTDELSRVLSAARKIAA